jgi:hypothetical protein
MSRPIHIGIPVRQLTEYGRAMANLILEYKGEIEGLVLEGSGVVEELTREVETLEAAQAAFLEEDREAAESQVALEQARSDARATYGSARDQVRLLIRQWPEAKLLRNLLTGASPSLLSDDKLATAMFNMASGLEAHPTLLGRGGLAAVVARLSDGEATFLAATRAHRAETQQARAAAQVREAARASLVTRLQILDEAIDLAGSAPFQAARNSLQVSYLPYASTRETAAEDEGPTDAG